MSRRPDLLDTGAALAILVSAVALAAGWVQPLPWLGLPVLLGGLAAWRRLRTRILPALRLPWLVVVLAAAFGAADFVGIGLHVLAASLLVALLLALAQAAERRLAAG